MTDLSTLMTEAAGSSEPSVPNYTVSQLTA